MINRKRITSTDGLQTCLCLWGNNSWRFTSLCYLVISWMPFLFLLLLHYIIIYLNFYYGESIGKLFAIFGTMVVLYNNAAFASRDDLINSNFYLHNDMLPLQLCTFITLVQKYQNNMSFPTCLIEGYRAEFLKNKWENLPSWSYTFPTCMISMKSNSYSSWNL